MGKRAHSDEFKRAAVEQVIVQRHTITSVAKRLGLHVHTRRRSGLDAKTAATDSNHAHPIATNLLDQDFARADGTDKVWGVGITFIHTDAGVLYSVLELHPEPEPDLRSHQTFVLNSARWPACARCIRHPRHAVVIDNDDTRHIRPE